jgi:hypothetical protein
MAKKKTISKIALVSESLRSQNQQISDLQKDVSELENIALLILEKVRRMEKYTVVQTKKGKLIPAKVGVKNSATLQPANDPIIGSTENDTENDILMKIYNFMVKNAEKQKREKELEKNFEQENKQEKQRRYEKVVKEVGLDPSKLKKRGFLSTAGKLVKGTFWAGLGLALTGLVYLFKEEIVEFGKKILKGIEDIGNLITSVVDFVKGGYEKIMNFLQPMVNWIKDNPLTKYIKEQVDSMGQQGSSILTTVMNAIKTVADDIWDKITQWFARIADTIMAFVNSPTKSKVSDITNFMLNHKAMLGAMASSMLPGPVGFVGSKVLGALAAHEAIAGAGAEPSPYHSAKREAYKQGYSDKFYQQTMDVINRFTDKDLKTLLFYENGPLDYLNYTYTDYENGNVVRVDRVKLANDFIDDPKLMSILVSKSVKKDVLKKDIDTRDEQFITTAQEQLKNDFPEKNYEIKPNGIGGFMISENGNIIADSMKTPVEFFRLRTKSIASRALQETFNNIVKKVEDSDAYKATKSTIQEGGEKLEQAQEEFQSATANFTSSARQTYSGVTSSPDPTQKASEIISQKASEGISATKSLFDDKVKPSLEKIDTGAFMEEAKKQYLNITSFMSDLSDPEKRNEMEMKLQEFAQNPIQKIKEIGQDPAEDPFNLNAIFEQQKQASINNKFINSGSTSTGIEDYSAIPVRNLYSPFRNSNILSTVNP